MRGLLRLSCWDGVTGLCSRLGLVLGLSLEVESGVCLEIIDDGDCEGEDEFLEKNDVIWRC